MKFKRSASFTKCRLISKIVKWLLEKVFFFLLQCSVFYYKVFIEQKRQKKHIAFR